MLYHIVASYLVLGSTVLVLAADPYAITGVRTQSNKVPARRNVNDLQAEAGPQWYERPERYSHRTSSNFVSLQGSIYSGALGDAESQLLGSVVFLSNWGYGFRLRPSFGGEIGLPGLVEQASMAHRLMSGITPDAGSVMAGLATVPMLYVLAHAQHCARTLLTA